MGLREKRGCSNKEGAVCRERETGLFAAVSGSEKVVGERENFGSGEAAQLNGFNGLPHKHRKSCEF